VDIDIISWLLVWELRQAHLVQSSLLYVEQTRAIIKSACYTPSRTIIHASRAENSNLCYRRLKGLNVLMHTHYICTLCGGGDDVIQLRPAIPFMVVNVDRMCEQFQERLRHVPP